MQKSTQYLLLFSSVIILGIVSSGRGFEKEALEVSSNSHYLVDSDGNPFFWIGDTRWAMFQQLRHGEVDQYLDNIFRAQKTVDDRFVTPDNWEDAILIVN